MSESGVDSLNNRRLTQESLLVKVSCLVCSSRSSTTYDGKEPLGSISSGGGIAVPVVKSMSSGSWTHDNPSASWAVQPHITESYRYSAHQRLLLSHSAPCNPAGIISLIFKHYCRKFIDMRWKNHDILHTSCVLYLRLFYLVWAAVHMIQW